MVEVLDLRVPPLMKTSTFAPSRSACSKNNNKLHAPREKVEDGTENRKAQRKHFLNGILPLGNSDPIDVGAQLVVEQHNDPDEKQEVVHCSVGNVKRNLMQQYARTKLITVSRVLSGSMCPHDDFRNLNSEEAADQARTPALPVALVLTVVD